MRWIWQICAVHTVLLTSLSLKYVLIPQSCSHRVLPRSVCSSLLTLKQNSHRHTLTHTYTHTHTFSVLDLGELSVCVLCFLSISLMRRRLFCLSVCDFSGKDGWKKLDIDVRPTFHLEAGYPLSKHRTLLTNESDRKTGSEE